MKSIILLKRLNSSSLNLILGIVSVVLFAVVVALLIIPYSVVKLLACHTPIGRVPIPVSLS